MKQSVCVVICQSMLTGRVPFDILNQDSESKSASMKKEKDLIRIGTSGWSYPKGEGTWNGLFYPPKTAAKDELTYYGQRFHTVEINSTFYRPPVPGYAWNWVKKTPPDFKFTLKLWQKFTHPGMYQQATGEEADVSTQDVDTFRKGIEPLVRSNKLGSILVQFAASFRKNQMTVEVLDRVLHAFKDYPLVVELRHRTWSDEIKATQEVLSAYDASLAYIDEPKFASSIKQEFQPLGPIFYLRMHGRNAEKWFSHRSAEEKYNYLYSPDELKPFVENLSDVKKAVKEIYVFFNNHYGAKAAANAIEMRYRLGLPINAPFWRDLIKEYPELRNFPVKVEGEDLFGAGKDG